MAGSLLGAGPTLRRLLWKTGFDPDRKCAVECAVIDAAPLYPADAQTLDVSVASNRMSLPLHFKLARRGLDGL
jgi:hypothetical protein